MGFFRKYCINYLRTNIVCYFFMVLLFAVGVVTGALAVKSLPEQQKGELIEYLQIFFQGFSAVTAEGYSSIELFISITYSHLKTIGLIWLLGFTIVGIPIIWFIVFTRGFIAGFTVGFLINEYIMKGVVFAFGAILPHSILSVPAIIAAGVSATSFSLWLARKSKASKTTVGYEAVGYTITCGFILLILIIAAFVEAYLSPLFMKAIIAILF